MYDPTCTAIGTPLPDPGLDRSKEPAMLIVRNAEFEEVSNVLESEADGER
jgi:hypothetical protein